jgi:arginine exporter protein ArgO
MSIFKISVFGFTRSILTYFHGFSLTMGCLMIAIGTLNLLFLKEAEQQVLNSKLLSFINGAVALCIAGLSIVYFHWPPIILFLICSGCFFIIFYKNQKK